MTFQFKTISCCNCDKVLASYVTTDLIDALFYCPDCVVGIEDLRYKLKIIDMQTYARAYMNLRFHLFTARDKIRHRDRFLHPKFQSYGFFHAKLGRRMREMLAKLRL